LHARDKDSKRKKYQVGHIFNALLPNAKYSIAGFWQQRAENMAYLIFFSFSVFVPRMHLSTFLCQLHGFPMVGFGFTTPVHRVLVT